MLSREKYSCDNSPSQSNPAKLFSLQLWHEKYFFMTENLAKLNNED